MQLDLSVDLAGTKAKGSQLLVEVFSSELRVRPRLMRAYLLPLVRLGDPRMWDYLGCVNFVGGEVGHLVAFCKTSLENTNKINE